MDKSHRLCLILPASACQAPLDGDITSASPIGAWYSLPPFYTNCLRCFYTWAVTACRGSLLHLLAGGCSGCITSTTNRITGGSSEDFDCGWYPVPRGSAADETTLATSYIWFLLDRVHCRAYVYRDSFIKLYKIYKFNYIFYL